MSERRWCNLNPLKALRQTMSVKDLYLARHHASVMLVAGLIALELNPEIAHIIFNAASVHDTGKIGIPGRILFKPSSLTEDEWMIMRCHPVVGAELLEKSLADMRDCGEIARAVRHHHERWDGGGYPEGLSGYDIPLAARIVAIADTYDAMTSDRPYRKALPVQVVRNEIILQAGKQFDPELVHVFDYVFRKYINIRPITLDQNPGL